MPFRVHDVVSFTSLDTKPRPMDTIEILLLTTDAPREMKVYRDLALVKEDFPDVGNEPSKAYRKVKQLFDQGRYSKGRNLFGKVTIIGIAKPETPAALVDAIESIRLNYDDWYAFATDIDDQEYQEALIAYAHASQPTLAQLMTGTEDNRKLYFFETADKEFPKQELGRAVGVFVNDLKEEGDFAYLGVAGPFYPKSVNWKFMRPDGVSVADLSVPEKKVLHENHINYMSYENRMHTYMKQGVCTDGEFIATQIGADFLNRQILNEVYAILVREEKVPYNNDGFSLICSGVTAALDKGVDQNIIDLDPESKEPLFRVTIPTLMEATDEQIRSGVMPDIPWAAQIQTSVGAVTVTGTLTVDLSKVA